MVNAVRMRLRERSRGASAEGCTYSFIGGMQSANRGYECICRCSSFMTAAGIPAHDRRYA
ncbi:hypothetical protein B4098_0903 [Heyndrickxia coagulans]|uniref:Uncharacterized protein n=1 Tax=Heyndrickxia coagulans TaxID=1398 RepID=A0A150JZK0_HEYCO|nr:hypothetical protein BCO26_0316 [Heyndrickxia coagulans 2-6]KYC62733.1 hypothetical protein B4098_0903 [Heyndrickxia coagulans]